MVQNMFANQTYMRYLHSNDLIEVKLVVQLKTLLQLLVEQPPARTWENARAAVITRGILEVVKVVELMGGRRETAFGLTGIGDLIVTASSENSRNFQGGKNWWRDDSRRNLTIYPNNWRVLEQFMP